MEQIFLTAAVLLLPMLCTTAGAAGVFLLRKTGEPATRRMLCGMAAGIMLAASVWSLLLPAIERAEQGPLPAWVPPAVGLLLGPDLRVIDLPVDRAAVLPQPLGAGTLRHDAKLQAVGSGLVGQAPQHIAADGSGPQNSNRLNFHRLHPPVSRHGPAG